MFVLVRPFGILAQAGLLSFYFVTSVGLIVWKGLREITAQQHVNPDPEDAP